MTHVQPVLLSHTVIGLIKIEDHLVDDNKVRCLNNHKHYLTIYIVSI